MTLAMGTRLGSYEIGVVIGAGGMGEVYRARDTRLNRDVAIKVLPELFAADPERLKRFEREAQTLAALNHPNIAQIYGLEESAGVRALVMELVDGEDLSQRIARGTIPVDEAIPIARQIADALEAAHEQSIIHRDLKPANVKVRPDGAVKVLDFGLAKAMGDEFTHPANLANSPTFTSPVAMTQMGVILGTAAYMAPEQARGRAVDRRADIWAFGCVLFEMIAGRRPFAGQNVADVLATIIERDPDWTWLPGDTPLPIRRLLRRCLEKDPRERLSSIADARFDLDEARHGIHDGPVAARTRWVAPALVIALAVVAGAATWRWLVTAPVAVINGTYVAATLALDDPRLSTLTDRFALSPDGQSIVLTDRRGLVLRRLSNAVPAPIPGCPPDAYSPVFSPDGKWIAFSTNGALAKIPVEGGSAVQLAEGKDYFSNLAWSADGRIWWQSVDGYSARSISANGGPIDTIDFGRRTWVGRAEGLAGGRLLASIVTGGEYQVVVREKDGAIRKLVAGRDARVAPTGYLLYTRQEGSSWALTAVPFDTSTAAVRGEPITLVPDVPVRFATPAAAGPTGDLFYIGGVPRSERRLVIVDEAGAEQDVAVSPGAWTWLSLSPDGTKLAVERWEGGYRTIWALAFDSGALTQLTYGEDTMSPNWMADSRRVMFADFPSNPDARVTSLWSTVADGRGRLEPLPAQWDAFPGSVSSDGRTLYYTARLQDQSREDILSVRLDIPGAKPVTLLATPKTENQLPTVSPDNKWMAYAMYAAAGPQVRIAPLSDLAASTQVSSRGGGPVRWSADGTRFYYVDGTSVVGIDVGSAGPVLSSRRQVFALPSDARGPIAVMADGRHAVMIRGGAIYSDLFVMQHALPKR